MLTVRGDSMNRARFGDEVTPNRFVRIDDRRVELRPESHDPAHEVLRLDLAKHILGHRRHRRGRLHRTAARRSSRRLCERLTAPAARRHAKRPGPGAAGG